MTSQSIQTSSNVNEVEGDLFAAAQAWNAKVYANKEKVREKRRSLSWEDKVAMAKRLRDNLRGWKKALVADE